jgi:hypothetical protein
MMKKIIHALIFLVCNTIGLLLTACQPGKSVEPPAPVLPVPTENQLAWPDNGKLSVPLLNKVNRAYLLANPGQTLKVKNYGLNKSIDVPVFASDQYVSVVVLEMEGQPEVLPIPTAGRKVSASSEQPNHEAGNLTDGNPKNTAGRRLKMTMKCGLKLIWVKKLVSGQYPLLNHGDPGITKVKNWNCDT